jgi:hypothetical protein
MVNDAEKTLDIDELKTILSLEHGESMNLFVRRADDRVISKILDQFIDHFFVLIISKCFFKI